MTSNAPGASVRLQIKREQDARKICVALRDNTGPMHVFGGFAACESMASLAKNAGLTRATLYRRFANKEDIEQYLNQDLYARVAKGIESCVQDQVGTGATQRAQACLVGAVSGLAQSIIGSELYLYNDIYALSALLPNTAGGFIDKTTRAMLETSAIEPTHRNITELDTVVRESIMTLIGRNQDALARGETPSWPSWPDDSEVFEPLLTNLASAINKIRRSQVDQTTPAR